MVEEVFHFRCHKKLHINAAIPMPVKNKMKITNAIKNNVTIESSSSSFIATPILCQQPQEE